MHDFYAIHDSIHVTMKKNSTLDQVVLVDRDDTIIGYEDKFVAHRNMDLHRAASVFLFRTNPETQAVELLLQQRSDQKIVAAGLWSNTVCGNVIPNEDYRQCAVRRLRDELGLVMQPDTLEFVQSFYYKVQCNEEYGEHEIVHFFCATVPHDFDTRAAINASEVSAVRWQSVADLRADDPTLSQWMRIYLEDPEIQRTVFSYVTA